MTYGPNPWQQTAWDWRAAANFIGGGAGSGLIVFAAAARVEGTTAAALLLAGLALLGLGLACVWAELGRPLRALHVFFNPRTSWMTREAIAATALFPVGALAALAAHAGVRDVAWLPALLAAAFIYCQSRMLQAARGIPAWREPRIVALLLATSFAEGAALFWLAHPWHGRGTTLLALVFGAALLVRIAVWYGYRRRLDDRIVLRAAAALDIAGGVLLVVGTVVPLALLVAALSAGGAAGATFAALAGLAAAAAGAFVKLSLITRAGFNQGFALQRLPVRGQAPHGAP